jgi:hypothetical protein
MYCLLLLDGVRLYLYGTGAANGPIADIILHRTAGRVSTDIVLQTDGVSDSVLLDAYDCI